MSAPTIKGQAVGTLAKPSILGATGSNPFLPQNSAAVAKTATPVIATAPAKTPAANLVPQTPAVPAVPVQQTPATPAAPTTALVVANQPATPVATGPSTGRKVVDIACAVYNHLPSGSTLAAAGAAVGYQFSGPAVAVAGAVVGFALPYIARTAAVKLAPKVPSLQPYATQLTHQPKVVQGLNQAGLVDSDLVHIDVTALTAKMAKMADTERKVLFDALAILKASGILNPANAKAVIDSPNPMELIQTMVAQTVVFAAVPCRNAIVGSKNPQAMAKTFQLLGTVQILDKTNNLAFVQSADPVALESIVTTLATAGVLNEAMFEKVKASRDLKGLAAGLKKLEAAGLLKKEKSMLGRAPGLLEGIAGKGSMNKGEFFLAVMDAVQPNAIASGLVELQNAAILDDRGNFQAIVGSADPENMGIALAQLSRTPAASSAPAFEAVRKHPNPRSLGYILKLLNEASPKTGPHLLTSEAFQALMTYRKANPVFLEKALKELKNAKILDAATLSAVLQSDEPLSLAQLCGILAEVNYFNSAWIHRLPASKTDAVFALEILKKAGVISSTTAQDLIVSNVSKIFAHVTPIVEARRLAQEHHDELAKQSRDRLAAVRAAVVPVPPVAIVPVIQGTSPAEAEREAAVIEATNMLTGAGIAPTYVDTVKTSALPKRMAAAIVRLAELEALTEENVVALKAQDTVLPGANDLYRLAQNLARLI